LDTELAKVSAILSIVVSASSTTKVGEKHRVYSKQTALFLFRYQRKEYFFSSQNNYSDSIAFTPFLACGILSYVLSAKTPFGFTQEITTLFLCTGFFRKPFPEAFLKNAVVGVSNDHRQRDTFCM
jgi:hypothetical protein